MPKESNAILSVLPRLNPGPPMPSPLLGDKLSLPASVREEIQGLSGPRPGPFLVQLALAWGVIAAAIAVVLYAHFAWPVYLAAVFIIATRQNLLGLLVHEQAHYLGFRSKGGEQLVNFFAAYPLMISVEGYAGVHLAHHKFYFTEKDPDYLRKQGEDWTLPYEVKKLVKLFLTDASGMNTLKTLQSKKTSVDVIGVRKTAAPKWLRPLFYGCLAIAFTWFKVWTLFLLFWVVPLATLLQIFVRWGALCEHKYNLVDPGLEESTPLIKLRWWEKVLFPNLNFTYHIYHHYFPGVSFSNLPKVHRLFQRARLVNELNVFRGYGMFLHYLFRKPIVFRPRGPLQDASSR